MEIKAKTVEELYPGLIHQPQTCHKCGKPFEYVADAILCGCPERVSVVRDLATMDPDAPKMLQRSGVEEHDDRPFAEVLNNPRFRRLAWVLAVLVFGVVVGTVWFHGWGVAVMPRLFGR